MYRWRMVCFPWDLADESIETVLDLLHGELGATDIVVPLVTGSIRSLRRRPRAATKQLNSDGGFHFKVEARRYAACRVKPLASDSAREFAFLSKLHRLCEERGLGFGVRVGAVDVAGLCGRHPELCTRDAFGSVGTRFCTLNPEIADYVGLVLEEVRERFAPEYFELEGIVEGASGSFIDDRYMPHADRRLLSLCTCPSCRQIGTVARVDVAAAVDALTRRLRQIIEATGHPPEWSSWLDQNGALVQWVAAKREAFVAMLCELKRRCGASMDLVVRHFGQSDPRMNMLSSALGPVVGSVLYPQEAAQGQVQGGETDQAWMPEQCGAGACVPAFDGRRPDGAWLTSLLVRLSEGGIQPVDIEHFGELPESGQSALRQAIRYARRQ